MQQRLKVIRKKFRKTQAEFGDAIGVARDTVTNWELGRVAPPEIAIRSIVRVFGVDYGWLKDGVGDPFADENDEVLAAIDDLMTGENENAKVLLRAMAKFTDAQWQSFDEMLDIIEKERGRQPGSLA